MSDPVRLVRFPLKSSGPVGVASKWGRSSSSMRSSSAAVGHAVHHDRPVAADGGGHLLGRCGGGQMGDGHEPILANRPALGKRRLSPGLATSALSWFRRPLPRRSPPRPR